MNSVANVEDYGHFVRRKEDLLRMLHTNHLAIHPQVKRAKRARLQCRFQVFYLHAANLADCAGIVQLISVPRKRHFGEKNEKDAV